MTTSEYREALMYKLHPEYNQGYTTALLDLARVLPFAEKLCGRLTGKRLRKFLEFVIEHRVETRDNFRNFKLGYDKEKDEWIIK